MTTTGGLVLSSSLPQASSKDEIKKQANLRLLQRTCSPYITDILASATHVVLYEWVGSSWIKSNIEGSSFLVRQQQQQDIMQDYQLIIINRNSPQNFILTVTHQLQLQHQDPYLILKSSMSLDDHGGNVSSTTETVTTSSPIKIRGIWFHSANERIIMNEIIQRTVDTLKDQQQSLAWSNAPATTFSAAASSRSHPLQNEALNLSSNLQQRNQHPEQPNESLNAPTTTSSTTLPPKSDANLSRGSTPPSLPSVLTNSNRKQQPVPQQQQLPIISSAPPITVPATFDAQAATATLSALLGVSTDRQTPSSSDTITTSKATASSEHNGLMISTTPNRSSSASSCYQQQQPPLPPLPRSNSNPIPPQRQHHLLNDSDSITATAGDNNTINSSGSELDKKALQLALLSLIQDDRFLDLLHSQYIRVVRTRMKKQQQQQQHDNHLPR